MVDAANGTIKTQSFHNKHDRLIETLGEAAYKEGMMECGLSDREFDDEDVAVVSSWESSQQQYTLGFAQDAVAVSKLETIGERLSARDEMFSRVELWVKSLRDLGARGCARAQEGELASWELGYSKTHCGDCKRYAAYKPKRMKYWLGHEKLPRSPDLECSGLNCQCKLVSVRTGQILYP